MKEIFLICPPTFGYYKTIVRTLEEAGYKVYWISDCPIGASWYKVLLRLFPKAIKSLFEERFLKIIDSIDLESASQILVVKGEALTPFLVKWMRRKFPKSKMTLYLWDSIKNVHGILDIAELFDYVATFDMKDATKRKWGYRPLFFRDEKGGGIFSSTIIYDWCFIGTIHSDRHRIISSLRKYKNLNPFVFSYFQNFIVYLARAICDKSIWTASFNSISFKPMDSISIKRVVSQSRSVLDVEHPMQNGFTMRTIETLMDEKKLITTNRNILNMNLYHPSRVLIIERSNPKIDQEFLGLPFKKISNELRDYYSCRAWIDGLLQNSNDILPS